MFIKSDYCRLGWVVGRPHQVAEVFISMDRISCPEVDAEGDVPPWRPKDDQDNGAGQLRSAASARFYSLSDRV